MTPAMETIVEFLSARPEGATRVEMAAALPISIRHIENMTSRLCASGAIAWVKQGGAGKDNQTRRYYALEHKPAPQPVMVKPEKKPIEFRRAKQRTAAPATAWQGEARITSDTKVTVCPPFVDRRFEFKPPPGWKGEVTREWEQERGL